MQYRVLAAITTILSVSQTTSALSVDSVVDAIDEITKVSGDTADVAKQITSPINIVTAAPELLIDFKNIVSSVTKDIATFSGDATKNADFSKDEQGRVCDAFHDFVKVHQNLLSIVIGKNGLLAGTPFTAPIGAVLRLIEGGVDSLANGIIDLVPTCADRAMDDLKALDGTLGKAVNVYTIGGSASASASGGSPSASGGLTGSLTGSLGGLTGGLTGPLSGRLV